MITVLAVAYGGGHIAALLPVIARLRQRADVRVEVLALTTAAAACQAADVPSRGFRDFTTVHDARSRAHGQRLSATQAPHPAVSVEETAAYLGANYRDLEDQYGIDSAAERYATEGRQAFLPVGSMRAILQTIQPDVILTTSAPRAERATVMAARELNISAVVVVDLFALSEAAWLSAPTFGDRVCVLSESVRARVISWGRSADQVIVTGNPAFDSLGDPTLRDRAQALRVERGWDRSQVITWASQPEPSDPDLPRRIEQVLITGAAHHPRWQVVIRPHPSEGGSTVVPSDRICLSSRADHLHTLIHASDVVVTMTSTVGLEAVLAGKPLVTWDRSENTPGAPYAALGLSTGVSDINALVPTIAATLVQPLQPTGLPVVGTAAAQIERVVLGLLKR